MPARRTTHSEGTHDGALFGSVSDAAGCMRNTDEVATSGIHSRAERCVTIEGVIFESFLQAEVSGNYRQFCEVTLKR